MRLLRDLPLQRRLTLVIAATCAVVLIAVGAVLAAFEVRDYRAALVHESQVIADIAATNSQAALSFDDAEAARGILRALQADPEVEAARLYRADGRIFAEFVRDGAGEGLPDRDVDGPPRFAAGGLALSRPVVLDGKPIGSLHLQVSLRGMYRRLAVIAGLAGVVMAGALVLAVLLSARVQRSVSRPILALAATARGNAERPERPARAPDCAERNELGELTAAFNHMIERIEGQSRALREGEERVRAIIDSVLSAVVVTDARGRIVEWNARAVALFGWSREEAIGQDLAERILRPDERARQREGMAGIAPPGSGPVAMAVLHRDGRGFPAELSVSRLQRGGEEGFCVLISDISERRAAEQSIQAQVARLALLNRITRAIGERQDLASIFQAALRSLEADLPIDFGAVLLRDVAGGPLRISGVGHSWLGVAERAGLSLEHPITPEESGLGPCLLGRVLDLPDLGQAPSGFPRDLGAAGLGSLVAAPLLVESQVFGVLVAARRERHAFAPADGEFLRQLSEHVALAAHQSRLNGALQQAYDELRQTQQAAMQQERLRALGQMASGIAHDINNAISPVSIYVDMLLEGEPGLSPRGRKFLETTSRAIGDVAHTVARMREFYRQREEVVPLEPVDLDQLVHQVVDLTRARWHDMPQQRGVVVRVQVESAPGLPPVQGVASEIREALINLVFNAVDAMPEGGTLTVRTAVLPDTGTGAHVVLEVADTGVGMDEETRRRCLEPFFTTKGDRGTGLGLAMVYGVVQRHGADIAIASQPGHGTSVRVVFAVPATPGARDREPAEAGPAGRLRLLVIDDDPLLLRSLREALEGDGHLVVAAEHGRAGIDAFAAARARDEPFDAVLTDLGMPYVDGRAVAQAVKTASPHTPVILLTGWGQRMQADGEMPEHVDCLLSKPPNLRDLRLALARCLRTAAEAGR